MNENQRILSAYQKIHTIWYGQDTDSSIKDPVYDDIPKMHSGALKKIVHSEKIDEFIEELHWEELDTQSLQLINGVVNKHDLTSKEIRELSTEQHSLRLPDLKRNLSRNVSHHTAYSITEEAKESDVVMNKELSE